MFIVDNAVALTEVSLMGDPKEGEKWGVRRYTCAYGEPARLSTYKLRFCPSAEYRELSR